MIVTFFDASPAFLREAIESVRAQTCSDRELILVHDRSPGAGHRG